MKRFFKLVSMFVLAGATLAYTGCTDYDKDIDNLGQEVDALEGRLATLEQQVKNLEALKTQLETLKNTHDADVERLDKAIDAINESLKGYATKTWSEQTFVTKAGLQEAITALGVFATKTEVTAAKNLAQEALDSATTALGNVAALKTALGAYASERAIQAALDNKLDASQFNTKFDAALEDALKNDGKITKAIADAIDAATAEFAAMFYGELRSLVFIPDLYVGGIEAADYEYASYQPLTLKKGSVSGKSHNNTVDFKIVDGMIDVVKGDATAINPEIVVNYEMNPASAKVAAEDLKFIANDVETRAASAIAPKVTRIVSTKDGNLSVGMKVAGDKIAKDAKKASMFALQANVNGDTTVTSDYARLVASYVEFKAIAYKDATIEADSSCAAVGGKDHLWDNAKEALENNPTVKVVWNKTADLKKILDIHYTDDCVVYDMEKNIYGLSYDFALIDYISGKYETSDSQFAEIKDGVINPCGVDAGKSNGVDTKTSIGRRPLVQVTVKDAEGKIVLVGYINVEIIDEAAEPVIVAADEFKVDANFGCGGKEWQSKWAEMVDNVLEKAEISKVEFETIYKLEETSGVVDQYVVKGSKYEKLLAANHVGVVEGLIDAELGTTTSVLKWTLTTAELSEVYKKDGHTTTIYVRYANTAAADAVSGIYVPLTVTVSKPAAATVGLKIANYWFNDGKDAIINVHVPQANFDLKDTEWITDIDQVWNGNKPVFKGLPDEDEYPSYKAESLGYKYYFAPIQPKLTVDGVDYQLYTETSKIRDAYVADAFDKVTSNDQISAFVTARAADVNKGIFTNSKLYANTNNAEDLIATLNQTTGEVTYANTVVAKKLLNAFASQPRTEAKLLANIGIVAYIPCEDADIAYAVENGVNPYHFLRPINIEASDEVVFVDGVDSHEPEANVDLFGMFDFSDWRGRKFYEGTDYTNLWYFKYYKVKSIKVDIANVTTTLSNGILGTTKLTDVTSYIEVSHRDANGVVVNGKKADGTIAADALDITISSPNAPGWGEAQYNGLVKKFGYIHYQNNYSTVDSAFKLRFPVEITYEWGTIKLFVDATVLPTEGN